MYIYLKKWYATCAVTESMIKRHTNALFKPRERPEGRSLGYA